MALVFFVATFFLVTTTQITTLNSVITTKIKFLDFKMSVEKKKTSFFNWAPLRHGLSCHGSSGMMIFLMQ